MPAALDIIGLSRAGVNRAWGIIAHVLTPVELRDDPTTGPYDPVADVTPLIWQTAAPSVFLYDDKEFEGGDVYQKGKIALARWTDVAHLLPISTKAQVEETVSRFVWHVYQVVTPPGEAIVQLFLRR